MNSDCKALLAHRAGLLEDLTDEEALVLMYDWTKWARPDQLPPKTLPNGKRWLTWLILAGRMWGKTRSGAEWVIAQALNRPRSVGYLVGATPKEVNDVMIEGPSGILACSPPWFTPKYVKYKGLTWPNGSSGHTYSAHNYQQLRGPQCHWAWADEVAKWRYAERAWQQLQLGLRLPPHADCCVTTTPVATAFIKDLMKKESTYVTRGTTYDNLVNMADNVREQILSQYEGTRLGRQELNAEILEDLEGALWTHDGLDKLRCAAPPEHERQRVVVAVDPSGGNEEGNDAQGITVQALLQDGTAVLLEDCTCKMSPAGWGQVAVKAAVAHKADCIVYESNFGGQMVEHVIRTAAQALNVTVRTKEVSASRGKVQRAEPVAALYEQGKVKHAGMFKELEDELCAFTARGYEGGKSPNRADAVVWGMTELLLGGRPAAYEGMKPAASWGRRR